MVSNSPKLDRRTKQHTQFGVCEKRFQRYGLDKIVAEKKKKEKKN